MEYLAHSRKGDCPPQSYVAHVEGVCRKAVQFAAEAECYGKKSGGRLTEAVRRSADFHDLGKLDDSNQDVLNGKANQSRHLPVNHVDAGAAALIQQENPYSALAVYSHHRGLPNMVEEFNRGNTIFRDEFQEVRERTDRELEELLRRHRLVVSTEDKGKNDCYDGDQSVFFRMMLSCLADADHLDTAIAYRQAPENDDMPQLRAGERLDRLDQYVSELGDENERDRLRREMYKACRNQESDSYFTICDSPVGSGKTTAVMAHLLQQAAKRNARRIFVVLPYTNIIQQSVEVYRKALVLPGEDPEKVVAELHYRADFQNRDTSYLTALWRAPIIVTTAVAFYETLASNRPATLRRLHELPGSMILVDESHSALPLKLLPLAWRWMNTLAEEWGCYWVLASGSLVRFWQLDGLRTVELPQPKVQELVNDTLRNRLMKYEAHRIKFLWKQEPLSRKDLADWVQSFPGPRLLIMNTVQSAAVLADDISGQYGRKRVEHLSTALTPEDRAATIQRVKERLNDRNDQDWTLVATSCVEAGVDFSFRTGFRELSSLLSLLQTAGRVNRCGDQSDAEMWSFSMQDDSILRRNPALSTSVEVLKGFLNGEEEITPDLSTEALNRELTCNDSCIEEIESMINSEAAMQFKTVAERFVVIDSHTVTAVIDETLAEEIKKGKGDWQLLQKKAVSIRREKVEAWRLKEIAADVYQWTLKYDGFLGYMRGVLDSEHSKQTH